MLDVVIVEVAMVVVDESGNDGMVLRVAVLFVVLRVAVAGITLLAWAANFFMLYLVYTHPT